MSELPIKATLKAGGGFDAPWLTVDANDPDDLAFKLKALVEHQSALTLVIEAANALKAHNSAAPIEASQTAVPPTEQPKQQAWGQTPAAQQNTAPAQNGPRLHPTDTCSVCGQRPQEKDVFRKSDNKKFEFWTCPNQRSRDDGHYSAFRN